jgi:hypothetical protein
MEASGVRQDADTSDSDLSAPAAGTRSGALGFRLQWCGAVVARTETETGHGMLNASIEDISYVGNDILFSNW